MEEDFDNIEILSAKSVAEIYYLFGDYSGYVKTTHYETLLKAYKNLKVRHQRLLDLAGSSYL
jgi:GTP cyclohydrolase III